MSEILTLMNSEYGKADTFVHGNLEDFHSPMDESHIAPLNKAGEGDIAFCNWDGDKGWEAIYESHASYIVCLKALNNEPGFFDWSAQHAKMLIFVDNPRLWYMRMLKHFNATFQATNYTSVKSSSYVPENVAFNGEVIIGERCVVDPYVVFGADGFGYERNERGQFEKFPHLGGVRIGNDVDIGSHTCIDRATLPNEFTTVGDRCKLDNFVHVAHNVDVGADTIIVSHCNIGGSVKIGRQCWLAMSVTIKNSVKIGNRVILGNRANIYHDVDDNCVVVGENQIIGNVDEKEKWVRLVGPKLAAQDVAQNSKSPMRHQSLQQ